MAFILTQVKGIVQGRKNDQATGSFQTVAERDR
jgi:hypothetical protein